MCVFGSQVRRRASVQADGEGGSSLRPESRRVAALLTHTHSHTHTQSGLWPNDNPWLQWSYRGTYTLSELEQSYKHFHKFDSGDDAVKTFARTHTNTGMQIPS